MKEFPKFDHLLHWRCSCCQLKNMASVKVALIEMEKAARLGWILSLSCAINSSVIYTDVISVRACPVFNFLWQQYVTLSPFTCVCMCRTLCLWGFVLIAGSSRAPAWNGFILTAFSFRSLHRRKEKHCCVCVGTTCSLSLHSGRLSGVHPALMRCSNTQRHMYYVNSRYTWSSPDSVCSLVAYCSSL